MITPGTDRQVVGLHHSRRLRPGRRVTVVLGAITAALVLAGASACTPPPPPGPLYGADISWPNCAKFPMPTPGTRFAIIGVSGGRGFTTSRCAAQQVAWARTHHQLTGVYDVPNYPTNLQYVQNRYNGPFLKTSRIGQIANVGYAEAQYTIAEMRRLGLGKVSTVWLDVETETITPWSPVPGDNIAVLIGEIRGYNAAGYRVGFYSYADWYRITGGWQVNAPVWATSGDTSGQTALWRCTLPSFSGGPVMFSQWGDPLRDYDFSCPHADIYSALIQL